MSAPRRVSPEAPSRRGWCPGLFRPMPTGDGLLARIHPPLGRMTRAQIRAVADAATRYGNGHVDVTARANLQIRGVSDETRAGLAACLTAVDLGDVRADGGPQRLTLTSPHAGLAPAAIDVPALARAVEAEGLAITSLPAKTLVLIEAEARLPGIAADLYVRTTEPGRAAIGLADGDGIAGVAEHEESGIAAAVGAALRAFSATGRRRIRDLGSDERAMVLTAMSQDPAWPSTSDSSEPLLPPPSAGEGGPCVSRGRERGATEQDENGAVRSAAARPSPPLLRRVPSPAEGRGSSGRSGQHGSEPPDHAPLTIECQAPFGRCTAAMLHRLADVAEDLGSDDVRLTPERGFVIPVRRSSDRMGEAEAALAEAGFVTAPDDPRRAVAACPGAPACASGSTATGADAARLAEAFRPFAASGMSLHVSGCAKGCAHPSTADLTLVGRAGRYGIVLGGTPGDAPTSELTFEAALERVWRARSGTLSEAFLPSSGSDPRCEPAPGTLS